MSESSMWIDVESIEPAVSIIGFGPAGFNAALSMHENGYKGPIRVFTAEGSLPYSPILTSYYAAGLKSYDECFPWSVADVDELELEIFDNCPVEQMDVDKQLIVTPRGTFPYTKCVIATGATPQSVGFPQECSYVPIMLRTMEDAERLKSAITDPACERVLVSGASMVALKVLEACLLRGKSVALVGMNPHVLDFSALPEAAERFEGRLMEKGIELRLGQTIKNVKVVEDSTHPLGRILEVEFSSGDVEAFDEIAVAHGMKCNLDFLEEGALKGERALEVDDFMRTSNLNVYAAGDVAKARELISGEKRVVGIWKTAVEQGRCAGRCIASELAGKPLSSEDAYKGSLPANTIAVDGTLFISAGTMEMNPQRVAEVREGEDMTVIYIWENLPRSNPESRRLVGFNIASDTDEEGSKAFDIGAMLTMRIERGLPA